MFKHLSVFSFEGDLDFTAFAEAIEKLKFQPTGATQHKSAGFVPPRDAYGAMVESIGGQYLLRYQIETRAVPGQAVKQALNERLDRFEKETGRRPKGKVAKELKEEIVHDLMPRAFPRRAAMPVWIDPDAKRIVVGAGSSRTADEAMSMLVTAAPILISMVYTEQSPATCMAHWLHTGEAPSGFTIDRNCVLKQFDGEKSAVRYSHHTLDIDQVREHVAQGKLPTQLELTWNGRVSFILKDSLQLSQLKLLDVVLENSASSENADAFDTDVAITTGELSKMLPDLFEALGGIGSLKAA